jgi:S1-C subfamily serine protease
MYATEIEDKIVVVGLAARGPARSADIRTGDIVLSVAGREISELATLFRKVWSLGHAGVEVPMLVYRDGRTIEVTVKSGDRNRFLKGPSVH